MKRVILSLLAVAAIAAACAEDDATGEFALATEPTTTTVAVEPDLGVDLDAAADPAAPIEIPDNALDFTGQAEVTVQVQDNKFEQRVILIDPGTMVTWINEGIQPHNVQPAVDGAFDAIPTGDLDPGVSGARTFADAGDYPYFCSLHGTARNGQTGRIIVVA
jgi:plastocyanin